MQNGNYTRPRPDSGSGVIGVVVAGLDWVRIFYRDENLIDFTELIAIITMPRSGSIANG
jgi:hypothetical protein